MAASAPAVKRLTREYEKTLAEPDPWFETHMEESNILLWYFVFGGAPGTPYEGGEYMGKIVHSPQYPFKPPSIFMITPSGRFQVEMRLCLSFSDFHPEEWGAGWSVKSMILGIQSFMMDESDPSTHGSIHGVSAAERKRLAKASIEWNQKHPIYQQYFAESEESRFQRRADLTPNKKARTEKSESAKDSIKKRD